MSQLIKSQTLKGFRDFLPEEMRLRLKVFEIFRSVFEKYGYEPLETPTLEYAEILLGKYGNEAEKLIYQFTDRGGRRVAMKYDLTVPASRVIAQYQDKLPLPFKRYQIQPVWRAENTQKGRFREFYQCDADVFGISSMLADAEFIMMGLEIMEKLGFKDYLTRINNRKLINGIIKFANASDNQFYNICIAIDKLEKVGIDGVKTELKNKNITDDIISKIFEILSLNDQSSDKLIDLLSNKLKKIEEAQQGLNELKEIFDIFKAARIQSNKYKFDLSIIRGLSYYTGPVWEFVVKDGGVGSIAGCGRYDKLISLYLDKDIPATGGSFGIERIVEIIKDRKMLSNSINKNILVTIFSPEFTYKSLEIANRLRYYGLNSELYLDNKTRLDKQLKYASRKGIQYIIIAGPEEINKNKVKLKNMKTGEQKELSVEQVVEYANQS